MPGSNASIGRPGVIPIDRDFQWKQPALWANFIAHEIYESVLPPEDLARHIREILEKPYNWIDEYNAYVKEWNDA